MSETEGLSLAEAAEEIELSFDEISPPETDSDQPAVDATEQDDDYGDYPNQEPAAETEGDRASHEETQESPTIQNTDPGLLQGATQEINQLYVQLQKDLAVFEMSYANINWEQLRRSNPAEWAAQQRTFEEWGNRLAAQEKSLQNSANIVEQAWAQRQYSEGQAFLDSEKKAFRERVGLASDAEFDDWKSRGTEYLKDLGATEEEISYIGLAWHGEVIDKAMKYDQLQSDKPTPRKRTDNAKIRGLKREVAQQEGHNPNSVQTAAAKIDLLMAQQPRQRPKATLSKINPGKAKRKASSDKLSGAKARFNATGDVKDCARVIEAML